MVLRKVTFSCSTALSLFTFLNSNGLSYEWCLKLTVEGLPVVLQHHYQQVCGIDFDVITMLMKVSTIRNRGGIAVTVLRGDTKLALM